MTNGASSTEQQVRDELREIKQEIKLVTSIVRGNEITGLRGLLVRVRDLEEKVEFLLQEKERQKWTLRGIALGLGITGLSGIGNLIALLRLLAEVGS